jgi:hypothetical protein
MATPNGPEGSVTVVVEPSSGADPAALPGLVRRAVADTTGVAPTEVLVVGPGTVMKTTSGKLRRSALRAAFEQGTVAATHRWPDQATSTNASAEAGPVIE